MRIDAHMHVNFNGFSHRDLISYLDTNHIDCCWLLTWEELNPGKWHYQHLPVDDVWETYLRHPTRIIPMYAPDPCQEGADNKLIEWHGKGIRGCAELKAAINWDCHRLDSYLSVVSRLAIPLLFHMEDSYNFYSNLENDRWHDTLLLRAMRSSRYGGLPSRMVNGVAARCNVLKKWKEERSFVFPGYMLDFASLSRILSKYPFINFIGHGPFFWRHICKDIYNDVPAYPTGRIPEGGLLCELLRQYPNLYADTSGRSGFNALSRDLKFSRRFVDEFRDKIIFGTDNCSFEYDKLFGALSLDQKAIRGIMGENASKLVRIQ